MGTNAYMGRTTVTELRERIRKLGGTPKGRTKAQLLDELEQLGDGGAVDPGQFEIGTIDDVDVPGLFGGGQ